MHRKIAAALVAAFVLGSCGGSARTETVSRAEAVKRLQSACLSGQRAARRELRERGGGQAAYIEALRANLRTILDEVGGIEPSGTAKTAFDAYKDTLGPRFDALGKIASADRADRQRVIAAQQAVIEPAESRAHLAIIRLGAEHVCL